MKKAVITGATGAIGLALINELISHGVQVLVLCRRESKRCSLIPCSPLVRTAYCSLNELNDFELTADEKFDVFYHFAWDGTFGNSRNDTDIQIKNIQYSLDAVRLAKRLGCHTFIGAGSQAEYGRVEGKLTADTPAFPENGYGMAKLSASHMTRLLASQLDIRHIWTRILSVYGPHDGAGTMVSSTITKLLVGEIPQFTKGEQMWDYLYSGDAGRAFYLIGEMGAANKTYILGSGTARPLKEYIEIIRRITAPDAEIALGAVPYSDKQVMYLCADTSELCSDTGWSPRVSFEEGIKSIVEEYRHK